MQPPKAPANDDGPCKVSCDDCKASFRSHDDTNADGSFRSIVSLTGSYHVEGSGSFQFDFNIDSAAFQAQDNTVPAILAATALLNKLSGCLDGSYKLGAEIDGSVKDITTLNGTQLAGWH